MRAFLKLALIGGILIGLLVPILMLKGLVYERQARGREVAEDIARASSRAQHLIGPLLLIESEETLLRERRLRHGGQGEEVRREEVKRRTHRLVAPETLTIDNRLSARERRRGLFGALAYTDQVDLEARFVLPQAPPIEGERIAHRWLSASLVLGVGDARGIQRIRAQVDGSERRVEPGSLLGFIAEGVHVPLSPEGLAAGGELVLALDAQLAGTQSLEWSPLAGEASVSVEADWPHPSFQGQRLPDDPVVTDAGFSARWSLSRLSSQSLQALSRCDLDASRCAGLDGVAFGTRLMDPVDRYVRTDRAMKYALLLLVLVFGAVFFTEALRAVEVHPLQYGLTGAALAIFFLLLLALSEHIGFGGAYLLAATVCSALIGAYMAPVLGGARRGWLFGALVAGLYGLLYGLLQSEDYALLMGSLALFALLAGVMLATRRLDWRRVGSR